MVDDIRVAVSARVSDVIVTIDDNGAGMPPNELRNVFERFYRGSNAVVRYDGGSGLGLPVARAIVLAHGGKISLTPCDEGRGLSARIVVPVRDSYLSGEAEDS